MSSHGYPGGMNAAHNRYYKDEAVHVCAALRTGQSQDSQIGRLQGMMTGAEAQLVVTGAHQYFCPSA